MALRAASERNDRFVPVDGEDLGGDDCGPAVDDAACDDEAAVDVTALTTVAVLALGEVEGTFVK